MSRREYSIKITINDILIEKVIIDPHYEEKHAESISDELILTLVKLLDGTKQTPDDIDPPYSYFTTIKEYGEKLYKLVWLLKMGKYILA